MELAQGTVVAGRFRLVRELGRGGMGSVWLAHHTALDTPCAIKFIHGGAAEIAEIRARFDREAKAAASLRSTHVVQILDYGIAEDMPFLVMELLEGEDLSKRLDRAARLPPRDVLEIVTQVARALAKAHAHSIVHRDLKPENVFLSREDDREIVKVLDFGIAKRSGQLASDSSTKTGSLLGTPMYMSPEQAHGTKTIDHRSDLWSLAVIVYRCLTGRLPFSSQALGDLLVQIIVNPIPVPSHVAPDVPAGFDAWWAKAAARDPSQRFQSARELTDALASALGFSPVFGTTNDGRHPAASFGGASSSSGGAVPAVTPGFGVSTPLPVVASAPQASGPAAPAQGAGSGPAVLRQSGPGMHASPAAQGAPAWGAPLGAAASTPGSGSAPLGSGLPGGVGAPGVGPQGLVTRPSPGAAPGAAGFAPGAGFAGAVSPPAPLPAGVSNMTGHGIARTFGGESAKKSTSRTTVIVVLGACALAGGVAALLVTGRSESEQVPSPSAEVASATTTTADAGPGAGASSDPAFVAPAAASATVEPAGPSPVAAGSAAGPGPAPQPPGGVGSTQRGVPPKAPPGPAVKAAGPAQPAQSAQPPPPAQPGQPAPPVKPGQPPAAPRKGTDLGF